MAPAKVRMSSTKVIDAGQTSPESHHSRTSINADQKDEDDLVVRASDPRQVNGPDNTRQENEDNSLVEDSYKLPYHAKNHTERIEAPADINDASGGHTMSSDNRQSQTRQDTHGTGVSLEAIEAASAPRQSVSVPPQSEHEMVVGLPKGEPKHGQLPPQSHAERTATILPPKIAATVRPQIKSSSQALAQARAQRISKQHRTSPALTLESQTAGSTVQDAHTVSVASGTARSKPGQLPKVASAKTRIQKPVSGKGQSCKVTKV